MRAPSALFPGNHRFALIDRMATDCTALPARLGLEPLVPPLIARDADSTPALVDLRALAEPAWNAVLDNIDAVLQRNAQPWFCCFLNVEEGTSTSAVIEHLKYRLIINSPQGRALLRYYDPRVLRHLDWIFQAAQLRTLFGPITQWTLIEGGAPVSRWRPEADPGSWRVNATTRVLLDRVGLINQALSRHGAGVTATHRQCSEGEFAYRARTAADALNVAGHQYGLTEDDDLICFAVHALHHGPDFHQRPMLRALLAEVRQSQRSYADASANIDWTKPGPTTVDAPPSGHDQEASQ